MNSVQILQVTLRPLASSCNLHGIEEVVIIFLNSPNEVSMLQADNVPIKWKVLARHMAYTLTSP